MDPTLVILAAGAGSRYGGLKQLAPIGAGGAALLEYSAYDAVRAGFSRVVLVVSPGDEVAFRARLDGGMAERLPITYVHQTLDDIPVGIDRPADRAKPWGTVQAVLAAESEIGSTFAVVNADDFYGAESFTALAEFLRRGGEGSPPTLAMIGFRLARTLTDSGPVSRALCRLDDEGFLREIVEIRGVWKSGDRIVFKGAEGSEQVLSGNELVSMNMWGFTRGLFPELRGRFAEFLARSAGVRDAEFLLPDVVQSLLREGRVRVEVLRGAGEWCGITYRQDEARVAAVISSLVDRGRYPEELWS